MFFNVKDNVIYQFDEKHQKGKPNCGGGIHNTQPSKPSININTLKLYTYLSYSIISIRRTNAFVVVLTSLHVNTSPVGDNALYID